MDKAAAMPNTGKLTPRQRLVLTQLGSVSKTEAHVAKDAGIRTVWPVETARKHLLALQKAGLAVRTTAQVSRAAPNAAVWRITDAGLAALSPQGSDGSAAARKEVEHE